MNIKIVSVIIILLQSFVSVTSYAEARRDAGEADPLRKAQFIIRQLSQDKSRLEADNGKLNVELKAQADKLKELEDKLARLDKKLNKSQDNNQKLVERVKHDNERMTSLLEKYKETVTTLRASKSDNLLLANAVNERDQWIGVCREKNNKMYSVNVELLQRYRQKGIGDMLAEKESFTGVATVELENQEQEYHFRLEDLQIPLFNSNVN